MSASRPTQSTATAIRSESSITFRSFPGRAMGLVGLIAAITAMTGIADRRFLSGDVWLDILVRGAPAAIVACGLMLVIVIREIDISVGSLMAILAAALGRLISENHGNVTPLIGIPVILLLGTASGVLTGVLVTFGNVPSIIVTLGLLSVYRGGATLLMGGRNIDGLPEGLRDLARTGLLGIPVSVWTAGATILLTSLLIRLTPYGRQIFACGSSPESARMSGLPIRRLKILVFAWTGFLTALATIVDIPRLPKIESGIGMEFELLVVTCVLVGGVSIHGGRGNLTEVVLAVFLMTMIRPVLTFMDIGESGEKWTRAIQGMFILLAVIGDRFRSQRSQRPDQNLSGS